MGHAGFSGRPGRQLLVVAELGRLDAARGGAVGSLLEAHGHRHHCRVYRAALWWPREPRLSRDLRPL